MAENMFMSVVGVIYTIVSLRLIIIMDAKNEMRCQDISIKEMPT